MDNYLYYQGTDNTKLTGGLTTSGYSFYTGYSYSGTVSFDETSIHMTTNVTSNAYYSMFGTSSLIDFTPYTQVIVHYNNGGDNVNRTAYISVIDYCYDTNIAKLGVALSSSQTRVWDNSLIARNYSGNQSYNVYIEDIELVPIS